MIAIDTCPNVEANTKSAGQRFNVARELVTSEQNAFGSSNCMDENIVVVHVVNGSKETHWSKTSDKFAISS
ncbi:MAG: hypothetical protein CMI56_00970 [Parcubacteria group bacterium]|nr:hypothetical protein [Parcubacteria group bacterium]